MTHFLLTTVLALALPSMGAESMKDPLFDAGYALRQGHYAEALKLARAEEARNNPRAKQFIAAMYCSGKGVEKDYGEALRLIRQAGRHGEDSFAMYCMQFAPRAPNEDVSYDSNETILWLIKTAEAGDRNAQATLGAFYYRPYSSPKHEYQKAFLWLTKAAAQGDVEAKTNMGDLYYYGMGVPKDDLVALRWYREGAAGGDPEAMGKLGAMYFYGEGTPQNLNAARNFLLQGYKLGDLRSEVFLAKIYSRGLGVPKDIEKGETLMGSAAAKDPGWHIVRDLGFMYMGGMSEYGVARDSAAAEAWYQARANLGDPDAYFMLGELLINKRDLAGAAKMYTIAVDKGSDGARYPLAVMYYNGKGEPKDVEKAREIICGRRPPWGPPPAWKMECPNRPKLSTVP